jgi:deoxyribose-phosphate aldolase
MNNFLGMDIKTFGKYFDHTLLSPFAAEADFKNFCREGIRWHVKMLAVNPAAVVYCAEHVKGLGINVGAAVGFPLGQSTVETKVFEAADAIEKGADEIDYVINVAELKNRNYRYIEDEMKALLSVCRENGSILKVIFENCYLTEDEIKDMCEIANNVKPDFIKTSTGFGKGGATVSDVKLMREYAEPGIEIKASGGIKSLKDTAAMIEAGARRIGTSRTVEIMEEFSKIKG